MDKNRGMINNPIRVLCVFSTLDRGGAESMCMNLYRNVDRDKVQFDFVKHTHNKGDFEDEIIKLGGKIYEAPRFYEYNLISYKKWWRNHLRNHSEHQIIHGHYFSISDVYLKVAKEEGRVTIGHSHASSTPPNQVKGMFETVKNWLYRKHVSRIEACTDYCFACSQAAGEWMFKEKPFKLLNNAIDTNLYSFDKETGNVVRQELEITDNLVLGTVGRIMPPKNPLGIVKIFNEVYKLNDNARLLWVGNNNTDMGRKATELAYDLEILDKIIFTGVVDNVNEMLQAMDCFILPSFFEGLPVVAIEAQAAGLQCFISGTVTYEVCVTDRCKMLPIDNPQLWAKEILNSKMNRIDAKQQIIDAGYDIHTTAKWLQEFYLGIK